MCYSYADLSGEQLREVNELQSRISPAGDVVLLAVKRPYDFARLDKDGLEKLSALEKELSGKQNISLVAYAR